MTQGDSGLWDAKDLLFRGRFASWIEWNMEGELVICLASEKQRQKLLEIVKLDLRKSLQIGDAPASKIASNIACNRPKIAGHLPGLPEK